MLADPDRAKFFFQVTQTDGREKENSKKEVLSERKPKLKLKNGERERKAD